MSKLQWFNILCCCFMIIFVLYWRMCGFERAKWCLNVEAWGDISPLSSLVQRVYLIRLKVSLLPLPSFAVSLYPHANTIYTYTPSPLPPSVRLGSARHGISGTLLSSFPSDATNELEKYMGSARLQYCPGTRVEEENGLISKKRYSSYDYLF